MKRMLHQVKTAPDETTANAERNHLYPCRLDEAELRAPGNGAQLPFPVLASFRPRGWLLVETLSCGPTGLDSVRDKLFEHLRAGLHYGYAVVEEGHVGVFERVAKREKTRPQPPAPEPQ